MLRQKIITNFFINSADTAIMPKTDFHNHETSAEV